MNHSPYLYFVVLAVPLHEARNAGFNRRGRLEASIPHEIRHIGIGRRHIAGLEGQKVFFGLLTERLFKHLNESQEIYRLVIADIVESIGRRTATGVGLIT